MLPSECCQSLLLSHSFFSSFYTGQSNASHVQTKSYRVFKCHRLILSAYSDFFRQCFLDFSNRGELVANSSPPPSSLFLDIEPRTMESIISLIYRGYIEIVKSDLNLFCDAVEKLGLKDLKIVDLTEQQQHNPEIEHNHLKRRLTQELPPTAVKQQAIGNKIVHAIDHKTTESIRSGKSGYRSHNNNC